MITIIHQKDGSTYEFKDHLMVCIDSNSHPSVMANLGLNGCVKLLGVLLGGLKDKFSIEDALYDEIIAKAAKFGKEFYNTVQLKELENPGSGRQDITH